MTGGHASVALGIIAAVIVGTIVFGIWQTRNVHMNPEEYMVGGRSFGAIFLWLLLAGEIYTTFTFLGAAGWAYGKGAPAFYILCYGSCAYVLSFFLVPPIWRYAQEHKLLTGPDFLASQYGSRWLGVIAALVGFVFLVPYVTLQLSGLEILLRIAGYGAINSTVAVAIAFCLIVIFIFTTGLRGAAWASIIKDTLVLGGVLFAGIALPVRFFGSPAHVFDQLLARHATNLTLVGATTPNGTIWFVSTVLLTALGFYMWPQTMAAVYSARNPDTIRRNAIMLPLYQLMLLLVYFAGFTALLVLPGLKGQAADQSFMLVVQKYYSSPVLGAVAAAGCLAGLVPASTQVLGAASVFTKNVLGDGLGVAQSDAARTLATRLLVLVVAGLALGFWIVARTTLVGLLLIGYNGVTQFFPGVVLALTWKRATALGVGCGIIVGVATVAYLAFSNHPTVEGVNTGFFALILNTLVCWIVSVVSPATIRRPAHAAGAPRGIVSRNP